MRLFTFSLMALIFLTPYSASAEETEVMGDDPKFAQSFLLSTNGLCHSPDSKHRYKIKIKPDEKNVFENLDDCIDAGGKATKEYLAKLEKSDPESAEEIKKAEEVQESNKKLAGINWGVGLAYAAFGHDYIYNVTIDENSIVRVNEKSTSRASIMLESHYFFIDKCDDLLECKYFGWGPYISIGLGGEDQVDPLSTFGFGLMWGWKRNEAGASWNLGGGFLVDTKYKTLRSGVDNDTPTTETDPNKLIATHDEIGVMIIFSATF